MVINIINTKTDKVVDRYYSECEPVIFLSEELTDALYYFAEKNNFIIDDFGGIVGNENDYFIAVSE